jgi:putative colanic acid biosynthesis glycosyltransferase WcaI
MRVLVVTPYYAPDLGPSAALYEMLCENLVRLGSEVSVICAVPHYPTGRVSKEFRGRMLHQEQHNGVDVTRVWVPSIDRTRLGMRQMGFLFYQLLATAVGLRRRYDVLIASNPAFEVALPFFVLGLLRRKPIIYSVHEIYPDIGVKLGIFRLRSVVWLVDWMERLCLRSAACVRVLSEGYKKILEARGAQPSRLAVIHDWVDTDFIRPLPRRNLFSSEWGLDGSFLVMYAGNFGPTQGLEQVVDAARFLAAEPSIRFVFVGDGAARNSLQQAAREAGLSNIQFIPFQSRELLPLVLGSADVSLITLRRGLGTDSVPSKLYSVLASGRPVIAATETGTDTWNVVLRAGCGLFVEPENPQALAQAILKLYRDEVYRGALGANGRTYVVQHHSMTSAAREFRELLQSLLPQEKPCMKEAVTHGSP